VNQIKVSQIGVLRRTDVASVLVVAAFLAGCQSYAPHPPDLAGHYAHWIERHPSSTDVSTLAEALRHAGQPIEPARRDDSERVDLEEAELIALVFNPDLRLARLRAEVTGATLDHADLWDDPVLSAGLERTLASVEDPWEAFGSINFTLPISGRLEKAKQRADAAHHAQLYRVLEQEWQLRTQLRRTWIEWSAAREKASIARSYLDGLDELITIIRRMEEVGELARVQAGLFYIELHTRQNEARSLEAIERDREIELCRLMGLPPQVVDEHALTLAPRVAMRKGDGASHVESVDAPRLIRERHPRVLRRRAEHTVAERELALQIRRQYPDIVLGPGLGLEDGHSKLLFGISLPVPILNRNQQRIAEAIAEREHARAALETAYERLLTDFSAVENELAAAHDQLERMRGTIIPLVDEQYADARRIAELGEVDILLLLDTLRRRHEAKLDLIDLEMKRSLAIVRLETLLGPNEITLPIRASEERDADKEPRT